MVKPKPDNGDTTTIAIDADLQRRLKVKCAETGRTMREQVEQLIKSWLEEKEVRV